MIAIRWLSFSAPAEGRRRTPVSTDPQSLPFPQEMYDLLDDLQGGTEV